MANIALRSSTWTTTAGNKSLTAFTPGVGLIAVVVAANSGRTTAQPPTVTDNNSSGVYVQVAANTANTSADSIWVFVRTVPFPAAVSTTITMTQASDTGGGMAGYTIDTFSRVGADAVRQVAGQNNQAASGTPAPVFGLAVLTGNPVVGGILNASNPATMTAPSGWNENADLGYITPTTGLEVVSRSSGETNSTITWGSTSATAFASIAVEFDTSVPEDGPVFALQALNRAATR